MIAGLAALLAWGAVLVSRVARLRGVLSHVQAPIMTALFFFEAIGSTSWDPSMMAFFGLTPLCMSLPRGRFELAARTSTRRSSR